MHPEQQRAEGYLHRKGTQAPVATLREAAAETFRMLEAALEPVSAEVAEAAPEPGAWSPAEVVHHLVLSHRPAVGQLRSAIDGKDPGEAIPAHLQDADIAPWPAPLEDLKGVHADFLAQLERADEATSLEPKVPVAMVIKIDGEPVEWIAHFDWKAFTAGVRVHTLEHLRQLGRILG
jgi:hypothetical protein